MRRLLAALLPLTLAQPVAAEAPRPRYIQVELIAESAAPRPGATMLVGLRMVPKQGWHSYWTNPGEAGFPTVVEWSAPEGVRFGPLRHPAPSQIESGGMTSFVHEGPHVLVARMTLDREIAAGTVLPVTAQVSWAACSDKLCVPERATLKLQLTAGDGAASPEAAALRAGRAREPRPIAAGAFEVEDGELRLELPADARLDPGRARFFPDETLFDPSALRLESRRPLRFSAPLAGAVPGSLSGVVSDGTSAYRLRFQRAEIAAAAPAEDVETAATPAAQQLASEVPARGVTPASRPPAVHAEARSQPSAAASWPLLAGAGGIAALGLIAFGLRRRRSRASRGLTR